MSSLTDQGTGTQNASGRHVTPCGRPSGAGATADQVVVPRDEDTAVGRRS